MAKVYSFYRGAAIELRLRARGADPDYLDQIEITAIAKRATDGDQVPPKETPAAASFDVSRLSLEMEGGEAWEGWLLLIDEQTSAGLAKGRYVTTPAIVFPDSRTRAPAPVVFEVRESTL